MKKRFKHWNGQLCLIYLYHKTAVQRKKFEDLVAAIELTSVHIDLAIVTIINLDSDGMNTLF